jgi:hypothetical protein
MPAFAAAVAALAADPQRRSSLVAEAWALQNGNYAPQAVTSALADLVARRRAIALRRESARAA